MAGVVIAPVAILFMMFSLRTYRRRTALIIAREDIRYDDQQVRELVIWVRPSMNVGDNKAGLRKRHLPLSQGPLILTVTLVLAMITALVLTLASNFGQVTGL